MTFEEAATAIKARIAAQWAVLDNDVPLIYPNEQRPTADEESKQVHVEIVPGAPRGVGFGGTGLNRWRQTGEVIFRTFVPSYTDVADNEAVANGLADDAAATVRGYRTGELRFYGAGVTGGGAVLAQGNFYQQDAIAFFEFDLIG